jgi:hypothetical protein
VTRSSSLNPLRAALALALALAAVFALAACGDSEEDSDQQLAVTLTGSAKAPSFEAPGSAEAGAAEITFSNDSKATADMQLIRAEGDRSAEEVVKALGAVMKGGEFEEWMFAAGGIAVVKPGKSATVDQVLQPGTYFVFNTEADGAPDPSKVASFEVTGEESDTELEAGSDAVVTAEDADDEYSFSAEGLSSGETEILFDNSGEQPHHLLLAPIKGDASAEEIEKAFKEEKGPPPIEEKGSQSTAVIEGGEAQLVTVDLEAGRYAMFCFITDRDGGKPHALKGMVDEVEID